MARPTAPDGPEPREFARKLALLLDHVEAIRGAPYTFNEINDFLAERGVPLSRARWGYMLAGDSWRVRDEGLLTGLAELFGVSVEYLRADGDAVGDGALPAEIEAELHLVRALRRARVQNFAARNLGDTDPAAYAAIADYLDRQASAGDEGRAERGSPEAGAVGESAVGAGAVGDGAAGEGPAGGSAGGAGAAGDSAGGAGALRTSAVRTGAVGARASRSEGAAVEREF